MSITVNRCLFAIIALIVIIIGWYLYKGFDAKDSFNQLALTIQDTIKPKVELDLSDSKCVCAFDIDHTISCGNPKPFIEACIQNGCRLALNTARPVKYVGDVDLDNISFNEPHYDPDDFYYNPNSYSQTSEGVAEVKSSFLELLQNKYTIKDKKCVILLDDNRTNIETAKSNNFGTVKANRSRDNCGLTETHLKTFNTLLLNCNDE